jgi:hypothetical protein
VDSASDQVASDCKIDDREGNIAEEIKYGRLLLDRIRQNHRIGEGRDASRFVEVGVLAANVMQPIDRFQERLQLSIIADCVLDNL